MLYIVNATFEGGRRDEIIEADPQLVADWVEGGWVSEIDDRGDRIVPGGRATPPA
jgi:hypothetical protein